MRRICGVLSMISLLVAGALLAPAATITNSPAKPANNAPPPKTDKKSRGLPFHGNVAAIDKTGKSITMEGKKQRVFQLTAETKINKDKTPCKFEALTVGDYVGGYAREAPDGKMELVTLNITSQTPAPKTGSKGPEPKKPAK